MKTGYPYPSANLKIICVQQQVMSLHFSTLCFILHCMYTTCIIITIGLTCACNHANRVSGVNEYIFHVSPLGFTQNAIFNFHFYTYFVSCVHYSATRQFHYLCKHAPFWGEELNLKPIFNCLYNTNTPYKLAHALAPQCTAFP